MKNKKVIILGAGISGLTRAYRLTKLGYDVTVLEARDVVGGSMRTEKRDGYLIDFGPNSGLETSPYIREMVDDVGLANDFIYANEEGNTRYILKNNDLLPLPTGGGAFIKSKLFSTRAKFRLFGELFVGKSEDGYYQSIAEFVRRRLGSEFLDFAIDPFVSGVYAGDPELLSVKSAFPKLYRLEEVYGGLIKGMIKGAKERKKRNEESKQSAKMFSFINGMQTFPEAIAKFLDKKIILEAEVNKVERLGEKYSVTFTRKGKEEKPEADIVISALPAYITAKVFASLDKTLSEHLEKVFYPTVMVLFLGYDKSVINRQLDGFGFLIPGKAKKKFLGAIWSSIIFPNRAPEGKAGFTLFVGGARNQNFDWENPNGIIAQVLSEFEQIMNISGAPELVTYKIWERAIPQYNLGYIEHEEYFNKFEKENPGIYLTANYRGGISVGDCVKNNSEISE